MLDVLGVDIGGVIIDNHSDGTDTSFFGANYLATSLVPDAFEVILALKERFGDRIFVVSKCKERTQGKTLEWLAHHKFYKKTGVTPERVHFCRERHEKAPICEQLGITHFVDDKLEVLGYLTSVPNLVLFRPKEREVAKFAQHLPRVTRVETWKEIQSIL
jgi:hypothetical protein